MVTRVLSDDLAGGGTVTLGGLCERTVTNGAITDVSHCAGPDGETAMVIHTAGADAVVVPSTISATTRTVRSDKQTVSTPRSGSLSNDTTPPG